MSQEMAQVKEGDAWREITTFFPPPALTNTDKWPGQLAFQSVDVELAYLAVRGADLLTNAATLTVVMGIIGLLQLITHNQYERLGLKTLEFWTCLAAVQAAIFGSCLIVAAARRIMKVISVKKRHIHVQRLKCLLASCVGLGFVTAEVLAGDDHNNIHYEGYFHAQLLCFVTFVMATRQMTFRYMVIAVWGPLLSYLCASVGSSMLEEEVELEFVYTSLVENDTALNSSSLRNRTVVSYEHVTHQWYSATVADPFGHTNATGSMFIFLSFAVVLCFLMTVILKRAEDSERSAFEASIRVREQFLIQQEQDEKFDDLLHETIPERIVPLLRHFSTATVMQAVPEVTVLVAELEGFQPYVCHTTADRSVPFLNKTFGMFDRIVMKHGLEKISTRLGGRYVAVSGLPLVREEHAGAAAECALTMVKEMSLLLQRHPQTVNGVRIGLHTGPVIAGVLGTGPVAYDVWGETVATAMRFHLAATAGIPLISSSTAIHIQKQYALGDKGFVQVKKKGKIKAHQLLGRKFGEAYANNINFQRVLPVLGPSDISAAIRMLCAYPARADWSVLRMQPARVPAPFHDGLKVFGATMPRPRFHHKHQHGWETHFRAMEAQNGSRHNQAALALIIFALVSGEVCVGLLECVVDDAVGLRHASSVAGPVRDQISAPVSLASDPYLQGSTALDLPCAQISFAGWSVYALLTLPSVTTLLFVGFVEKVYIRRCSTSMSILVLMNVVTCTAFAAFTAPALRSDLGWYGSVILLMYIYFGGYVLVQYAYPVAVLMTLIVTFPLFLVGKREYQDPKYIVLVLHGVVHLFGSICLGQYERARRLHYGWWTKLRRLQSKLADEPGRCEQMLHLVLPLKICNKASELTKMSSQDQSLLARKYNDVGVLVLDLAGFTERCIPAQSGQDWMAAHAANKVAIMFAMLHDIFSVVEELADKHDVVFVRTIGAMCILTAGIPTPMSKYAEPLAHLAHDVFGFVEEMTKRRFKMIAPEEKVGAHLGLGIRAALTVGPVNAGFVGFHKFKFDAWGPTVERADQLQTLAERNTLVCDDAACALLARHSETFEIQRSRRVHLTGHAASGEDHMLHTIARVTKHKFIRDAGETEHRFWEDDTVNAECSAIKLIRSTQQKVWQDFMSTLQEQSRLRLTGKQGVQAAERQTICDGMRIELVEREELCGVRESLRGCLDQEMASMQKQQALELEQVDATLATVPGLFEQCLTAHWAELDRGAHLQARLTVTKALRLRKRGVFGDADAYAVFFFNGARIGQTEVYKDSIEPIWEQNSWTFNYYTQVTNTVRIDLYDWDRRPEREREFLGQAILTGRGISMLPCQLEKERVVNLIARKTTTANGESVGGDIVIHCTPLNDVFSETSAEQTKVDVRAAFDEIDIDGGGTLDRMELGQLSAKLGKALSESELDSMMAEIDTDGGGDVDFDEFYTWWERADSSGEAAAMKEALRMQRSAARTAERIFAQVDIDASGDVTYDEFSAWWKARSMASTGKVDEEALAEGLRIFELFDDDNSGSLDMEEFSQMLNKLAAAEWVESSTRGRRYFFNPKTKETRWTLPGVGASDELLDMFVDNNVKLELTGDKAAKQLQRMYDGELRQRQNALSTDPKVRTLMARYSETKLTMVRELVDATIEVFDAITETVDRQCKTFDEDVIILSDWLWKYRTVSTREASEGSNTVFGQGTWKKRFVELHRHSSKGCTLRYRKAPGRREMHSLELVGCVVQDWRNPALRPALSSRRSSGTDVDPVRWRLPAIMPDPALGNLLYQAPPPPPPPPPPGTESPCFMFTIVALEPFEIDGVQHFETDYYILGADQEEDLDRWLQALALPRYRPPPPRVLLREYLPGEFDEDGNGSMSEQELQAAFSEVERRLDAMVRNLEEELFNMYDVDRSGELSGEELLNMLEHIERCAAQSEASDSSKSKDASAYFSSFKEDVVMRREGVDANHDGSITLPEFLSLLPPKFKREMRSLGPAVLEPSLH